MCNTTYSFDDASLLTDEPSMIDTVESSRSAVVLEEEEEEDEEESLEGVEKMIQDLFHHDNAKVNATLDALNLVFFRMKKIVTPLLQFGEAALPWSIS
jgi:hypothetical protein